MAEPTEPTVGIGSMLLPYVGGLIQTAGNVAGGLIGQRKRYKQQRKLNAQQMQYQTRLNQDAYEKNLEMMKYQNAYNSPEAQMARYEAAGLNKNLVYGQGTPGNMQSAPQLQAAQAPHQEAPDYSFLATLGTQIAQGRLMQSQADLTENKADESGAKKQILETQNAIAKTNPMLDPRVATETRLALIAVANSKRNENTLLWMRDPDQAYSLGARKIMADVESLERKLGLLNADQAIKNKVFESKEYENALKEIQVKWMQDGEITPQHIYMGIMLLLTKMM